MARTVLYVFLTIWFAACRPNNTPQQQTAQTQKSPVSDSLRIINNPENALKFHTSSEIDRSGIFMFPLSINPTSQELRSGIYGEIPENGYWNIIFYNTKSKSYHLLSERRMIIRGYSYRFKDEYHNETSLTPNHIFYQICTDDLDKSQKLTESDPEYLFVSDKSGKNLRQISPTGYHLSNWQVVKGMNKVIMTVIRDQNHNNRFTDLNDETTVFEIALDQEVEASEIFSDDFKNKLKIRFNGDWKQIKK